MIDVKELTKSVVIKQEVADFLDNKSYDTGKDIVSLFAALYEAERDAEHPLVIEEEEYEDIIKAVISKDFVVDTGRYFVNVGAPIGREEFLVKRGIESNGDDSVVSYDLEALSNATPFTLKELESIVPTAYRTSDYVMLENEAYRIYQYS